MTTNHTATYTPMLIHATLHPIKTNNLGFFRLICLKLDAKTNNPGFFGLICLKLDAKTNNPGFFGLV